MVIKYILVDCNFTAVVYLKKEFFLSIYIVVVFNLLVVLKFNVCKNNLIQAAYLEYRKE